MQRKFGPGRSRNSQLLSEWGEPLHNEDHTNRSVHTALRTLAVVSLSLLALGAAHAQALGKSLIVVAHPDDEYYVAATVYRLAMQLKAPVDELVITNGEGGYRYSTLAESYYGLPLTEESVGRREMPTIRKQEALNAGRILGIRNHYFLDQKDEEFTTDISEGLNRLWDSEFVTNFLVTLLHGEHYKYVFTVLPRATTHGHHQAATVLAVRAIRSLHKQERPVLLAADTDGSLYDALAAVPESQVWAKAESFEFDRNIHFGFQNALSYQIVVSWMIAEHKSQGMFQTVFGKDGQEYFWVD